MIDSPISSLDVPDILDPMYSFKCWIREQDTPMVSLLLAAIARDLARRVYPEQARDVQRVANDLEGKP